MVVTHKAESKNEEIWDKVRARAMVTTDLGKGMAELGQQIAKLMATLTKVGQGSNPSSAPTSPQERGCGRGAIVVTPPVTQAPIMVGASLDRPPHPTAYPLGVGQGALEMGVMDKVTKGLAQGGRAQPIGGTQILSNALGAMGGVTWPGNALPQHQL